MKHRDPNDDSTTSGLDGLPTSPATSDRVGDSAELKSSSSSGEGADSVAPVDGAGSVTPWDGSATGWRMRFWGCVWGGIIVATAAVMALPRVPSVWANRHVPTGVTNADGRPLISDSPTLPPQVFFPDPDDYTEVYRAKKIAEGEVRRWGVMKEIDAPNGVTLHWTSPMDYLTAFAGMVGARWFHGAVAFEGAAALLPPVLGAIYLLMLFVFVSRIGGRSAGVLCGLLAAVSPTLHRVFPPGHVDHHCLLEICLLASIMFLRPNGGGESRHGRLRFNSANFVAGLFLGLAVWTSVLAIVFYILVAAGLAMRCRSGSNDRRIRIADCGLRWSCAAGLIVAMSALVDDQLSSAIDRASIVHFCVLFAGGMFFASIGQRGRALRDGGAPGARRLGGTGIAVWFFVVMAAITAAPHIRQFGDPVLARWHARIAELQPLVSRAPEGAGAAQISFEPMWERTGYLLPLFVVCLPFFAMASRVPGSLRWALGAASVGVVILTVVQLRWMDHLCTFVFPVIVIGLIEMVERAATRLRSRMSPTARTATALLILAGCSWRFATFPPLLLVRMASAAVGADPDRKQPETAALVAALGPDEAAIRCDFVARMIRRREADSPSRMERRAILCDEGDGPQLLLGTGLPVVAAPYHRAIDGIASMMEFFAERDPTAARARLDRLGVRYIVIPTRINDHLMNYEAVAFGELRSFDPPEVYLDARGRVRQTLRYRPEVTLTMAYRLAIRPNDTGIAGVELLYGICDDPRRPGEVHGMLFRVNDLEREASGGASSSEPGGGDSGPR